MERQTPEVITSSDYRLLGPVRQRQRRLTTAQVAAMAAKYEAGDTVYQLAIEYSIDRRTVSDRLKKTGVRMRFQPPPTNMIDEMVRLYGSGLSFATIGSQLRASPQTVRRYLHERGVEIRNSSERHR